MRTVLPIAIASAMQRQLQDIVFLVPGDVLYSFCRAMQNSSANEHDWRMCQQCLGAPEYRENKRLVSMLPARSTLGCLNHVDTEGTCYSAAKSTASAAMLRALLVRGDGAGLSLTAYSLPPTT